MGHDMGMDNMFKNFTANGCEGDGTVVGCVGAISFLEQGSDIGTQPG